MTETNDASNMGGFRKCGLFFSIVLALVAWSFLWEERPGSLFITLSAVLLLFVSLFKPLLLKWPYLVWKKGAEAFGRVMMNVMLILFFFFFMVPLGLLASLLKRDLLRLKMPEDGWSYWDRGPDSYWIPKKEARAGVDRYEKQY